MVAACMPTLCCGVIFPGRSVSWRVRRSLRFPTLRAARSVCRVLVALVVAVPDGLLRMHQKQTSPGGAEPRRQHLSLKEEDSCVQGDEPALYCPSAIGTSLVPVCWAARCSTKPMASVSGIGVFCSSQQ